MAIEMVEAKCVFRAMDGDFYYMAPPGFVSENKVCNFALVPRDTNKVLLVHNDLIFNVIEEWIVIKEAQRKCAEAAHAYLCELQDT